MCLKDAQHEERPAVRSLLREETEAGLQTEQLYTSFQSRAEKVKNDLLRFLLDLRQRGETVAGYGAAAKGNTLLNFCGVKPDLLPVICDAAPSKIGKFMPGSHIPIRAPHELAVLQPDYVLILPWNISEEVQHQNRELAERGTRFLVAVPELKIL